MIRMRCDLMLWGLSGSFWVLETARPNVKKGPQFDLMQDHTPLLHSVPCLRHSQTAPVQCVHDSMLRLARENVFVTGTCMRAFGTGGRSASEPRHVRTNEAAEPM